MAEVIFTREVAKATCKTLNKIKDRGLDYTGGIKANAAIYNIDGSVAIDYDVNRKKYYLELEKEVPCSTCGRALFNFESESLDELITIVKCFDS